MKGVVSWTDRLIESCWLTAIVAIPIYFNITTSRVFEPDKTLLLRSISIVLLGLWIVRVLANRTSKPKVSQRARSLFQWDASNPSAVLLVIVGIVFISTIPSLVFSSSPVRTIFGSYHRGQGILTHVSYLMLFASMALLLKRRTQIERVITAVIIASVPIAIYGILQHYGTDPIPWAGNTVRRVTSTMGNSIFVSAYMILAIPASLYKYHALSLSPSFRRRRVRYRITISILVFMSVSIVLYAWTVSPKVGSGASGAIVLLWLLVGLRFGLSSSQAIRYAVFSIVLALQLSIILFAQSRGPILGLTAGGVFYGVFRIVPGMSRRARLVVAMSITVTGILAVVALRNEYVQSKITQLPYVSRFSDTFSNTGTGQVRTLIWKGVSDLIESGRWRNIVGYGDETMALVYPAVFPPELANMRKRRELPDRAHNELLDIVVHRGAVGLIGYLLLLSILLHLALRMSRLKVTGLSSRESIFVYIAVSLASVGGIFIFDGSFRLMGLALSGSLLLWYFAHVFFCHRDESDGGKFREGIASLVVFAVTAHLVETQFSFGIAATYMQFWVWAALLPACLNSEFDDEQERYDAGTPSLDVTNDQPSLVRSTWILARTEILVISLLIGLMSILLIGNFLQLTDADFTKSGITWLLVLSWIVVAGSVIIESTSQDIKKVATLTVLIPAILIGLYLLVQPLTRFLASPASIASGTGIAVVLITVLLVGVILNDVRTIRDRHSILTRLLGLILLCSATGLGVYKYAFIPIRADTAFKNGLALSRHASTRVAAINQFREASRLSPDEDYYLIFLGREWTALAREDTTGRRETYLREALTHLKKARELSPLELDHTVNLARLYDLWASSETNGEMIDTLRGMALSLMADVVDMAPTIPYFQEEAGSMALRGGRKSLAGQYYRRAIELNLQNVDPYVQLSGLYMANDSLELARHVLRDAVNRGLLTLEVLSTLGYVEAMLGNHASASEYLESAIELAPLNADLYKNLLITKIDLARCDEVDVWLEIMRERGLNEAALEVEFSSSNICRRTGSAN